MTQSSQPPPCPIGWMAVHLQCMAITERAGFNPRPAGVICGDSATAAALAHLQSSPMRWWRYQEIALATQRSQKALDWALRYLRAQGLVEVRADQQRNQRYLRYRIVKRSGL